MKNKDKKLFIHQFYLYLKVVKSNEYYLTFGYIVKKIYFWFPCLSTVFLFVLNVVNMLGFPWNFNTLQMFTTY